MDVNSMAILILLGSFSASYKGRILSIFSKIEGILQSPFLIKSAGETRSPAPNTPFPYLTG